MSIGGNIRRLRRERGMTQQELAKAVGVSQASLANWEVGKTRPRSGSVERLADALGVAMRDLADGPGRGAGADAVGRNVRWYRERRGMTQGELADKAGVSPSAVSNCERGKSTPLAGTLGAVAKALGCQTADLVGGAAMPDGDEAARLLTVFERLDREGRDALMDYAGYLLERHKA